MTTPESPDAAPAPAPRPAHTDDPGLGETFAAYLLRTRWFAGKGRPFSVPGSRRVGLVPGEVPDGPRVVLHLVPVDFDDVPPEAADARELYQVPLACYAEAQPRLEHALVGVLDDPDLGPVHAYDALHDREALACWQRSFDAAAAVDTATAPPAAPTAGNGLAFRRLPGPDLDLTAHGTLFSGEQSNSSAAFGDDVVLKVFRKVTPGINPDVAVHEALTRAGSAHVAHLRGWLELTLPDEAAEPLHLAMLQEYLTTASDGWELALASVRNLFGSDDLHAREVGGDFSGESARLGASMVEVHAALAERFGTRSVSGAEVARLATTMHDRLAAALGAVPALSPYAGALRALYDQVAELPAVTVQRVHGDLHLGQTLRVAEGWKLVDFEGEPARPLAERVLPDSRWRDVAGMLRSFDYAPHVVERTLAEGDHDYAEALHGRAEEWSHRNRNHFLNAYAGGVLADDDRILLTAYEADKAVYETVYETRNRPAWVGIPLAAVARIGGPA